MRTIVSENHRTIAAKVTAELNIHLEDHVSTKTVRREFHKYSIFGTAATAKPPITE
jgi:adenosine deaminase